MILSDYSLVPRRRARVAVAALSGLIATMGAITVGVVAAPAAFAAPSCSAVAPTLAAFPSNQAGDFDVPGDVTALDIVASGGAGAAAGGALASPGSGATVSSVVTVSPGDTLSVDAGQQAGVGTGGESGGSPSGGSAPSYQSVNGSGGGGASFVSDGSTLLIAAGGGGGAGYGYPDASGGSAASGTSSQLAGTVTAGADGGNSSAEEGSAVGFGGGGGTTVPGAGGPGGFSNGSDGSGEVGGDGQGAAGGGGGGYAGGGGGGLGPLTGGGGAGSSYGIDAYTLTPNTGDGSVAISYEFPSVTSADAVSLPAQQADSFTVCTSAVPAATIVAAGALPNGVSFVDNGDGTGTLSGTPASGTEGTYPLTFTAANGNGSPTVQNFTLTVSQDTPAVSLSGLPTSSTFGDSVTFTAEVDGAPGGSAPTGTVAFQNDGASISAACDAAPVSTTAGLSTATCTTSSLGAGTDPITATYSGDTDYASGQDASVGYSVAAATPVVSLETSTNPSVFGQSVTATAAITPSDVAGSVQFSVNGTDVGSPVTVSSGSAVSPTMTDALAISDNSVGATFTPTDTTDYTTADASTIDQVVDQAGTTTTLSVGAAALSASVAAVAPGAGTPTGTVTFSVDGTVVGDAPTADGVATLSDTVPAGSAHAVSAVYSGDSDFTGSSDSSSRSDPTITAAVTSAHPKTAFGWYRSPVRVTFTCTTTSAPLTASCPPAVTLTKSQGGQSVTRTITATDGGSATVVVTPISIDRVKPHVALHGVRNHGVYDGAEPTGRCVGTDALSGITTCLIATVTSHPTTNGTRTVRYTALATDKAGNTATVHRTVRVLGFFVTSAPITGGAFDVRVGHHYTVGFVAKNRPRYIDATPAHGPRPTPFEGGPRMTYAGHGIWTITIHITKAMRHHKLWNIGVRSHGTLHSIRIRLST
jgi:hypothetical protein